MSLVAEGGRTSMATYVLIYGAASDSWYWHRLVPELEARGHEVVATRLPAPAQPHELVDRLERYRLELVR